MKTQLAFALFSLATTACMLEGPEVEDDDPISEEVEPDEPSEEEIQNGAATAAYPAVGALVIKTSSGTALCTGTIISATKMLTAAHCVVGAQAIEARFGSTTASPTARFKATGWTMPPGFNISNIAAGNDYAVVTFRGSTLTTNRPAIKLQLTPINSLGGRVIVGYGITSNAGGSGTKRAGTATVDSDNDKHLRIKATGTATHSCAGDSGGPMLHKQNGINYVVGVSSYGNGNCDGRTVAYYADVSAAATWLRAQGF
jgi:secreted trypsin-like serine protease